MSWFKPSKMQFAPFTKFDTDTISATLKKFTLPGSRITLDSLLSQLQQQDKVLSLTLRLPKGFDSVAYERDLHQMHDRLAAKLEKSGIQELNLHLIEHGAQLSEPVEPAEPFVALDIPEHTALPTVADAAASSTEVAVQPASTLPKAVQHEDNLTRSRPAPPTQSQLKAHPRINHIIVVASGKGGVGKSTTTVNLALALKQTGARVGILDADIYGPSIPTMLGTAGQTPLMENGQFVPLEAYDMPVLSIGNLTGDDNTPIVWRGPKATGALMQLFSQTVWPDLDYLLVDMPPGTGDIQLTLAQRIPVSGAVIVTTPQHIALMDAQKGIELFNKVQIPVLGVVENMATHICSKCGHTDEIFGAGGGTKLSEAYQVPLLGRLPLAASIRQNADQGRPSVIANDQAATHYKDIALAVLVQLAKVPERARDERRIF